MSTISLGVTELEQLEGFMRGVEAILELEQSKAGCLGATPPRPLADEGEAQLPPPAEKKAMAAPGLGASGVEPGKGKSPLKKDISVLAAQAQWRDLRYAKITRLYNVAGCSLAGPANSFEKQSCGHDIFRVTLSRHFFSISELKF